MKKLFLFVVVVALAGYAFWPYHTATQFRDALNAKDTAKLEKMVDMGSLRGSLREAIVPALEKLLSERFGPKAASMMSSKMMTQVIEKMTSFITPETLPKIIGNGKEEGTLELSERSWVSPTEFSVKFTGDDDALHMKFDGLDGWKVVAVKPSQKSLDTMLESMKRGVQGAAAESGATQGPQLTPTKDYRSPLDQRPSGTRMAPADRKPTIQR